MRWPDEREVRQAALKLAGDSGIVFRLLAVPDIIVDVIAYDIVTGAHDIPDPRLSHRGPWTEGWTPL